MFTTLVAPGTADLPAAAKQQRDEKGRTHVVRRKRSTLYPRPSSPRNAGDLLALVSRTRLATASRFDCVLDARDQQCRVMWKWRLLRLGGSGLVPVMRTGGRCVRSSDGDPGKARSSKLLVVVRGRWGN